MARIINDYDFTNLGLKTMTCIGGEKLKSSDYYETLNSGTLRFVIEMTNPLLKVDSKLGICVDIDGDNKLITVAEVVKEERTASFFYNFTLEVTGVAIATDTVVTLTGSTTADIERVILLDYDHIWEKSETPTGEREYLQYYFDNTSTTEVDGSNIYTNTTSAGISARREFYEGTRTGYSGEMFKSITYPIIDFFHEEFIHVIENKALVWMRRKAGGGLDTLTWKGSKFENYKNRNPRDSQSDTNGGSVTVIPDTEVVVEAAREKEVKWVDVSLAPAPNSTAAATIVTIPSDRTSTKRADTIQWQPTMAKFIGWPYCTEQTLGGGVVKFENATPFYFLKPLLDNDVDGNSMIDWDGDNPDVYPKVSFYINGSHAIPNYKVPGDVDDVDRTGAILHEGKVYNWTTISPAYKVAKYRLGNPATSPETLCDYFAPNAQEVTGIASYMVPGDGNEFYNVKFWRNDGDSFAPSLKLDSRQGLRFDRCDFLSIWDGYTYDYLGSTEMAEALVITNNSYDNVFENCNFEIKTAHKEVIYNHDIVYKYTNKGTTIANYIFEQEHIFTADRHIIGKRERRSGGQYNGGIVAVDGTLPYGDQKIGHNSAVLVENSGNTTFTDCNFKANYGQTCFISDNADNVTITGSRAETYYHNTELLVSKHTENNNRTVSLSNFISDKLAYKDARSVLEIYLDIFGSENDIITANAKGNDSENNDYMNGKLGNFSWDMITYAYSAYQLNVSKLATFITTTEAAQFRISEKYEYKPKGFWFRNQSSSIDVKGTEFFGEGIGFFVDNCTNSHYLEFENNRVDTYIDEGYLFRNVKYPKLRSCWGHTIAHSVYKFESCLKPVQFDCEAESDTGFGFEYIKGEPTEVLTEPYETDMWRVYDCHVYSGSGIEYDPGSMPAKIDFGTFIQTANSTQDSYVLPEAEGIERSLVGIKLYDMPYKASFRNLYFKGIKNDIDIYKGDNVELYLENAHFAANREIHGTYSSPAYFIHKGFSGVWEYRDIGGAITTSAVTKQKNDLLGADTSAGFSLAFKSHIDNELGRSTVVLGNSNDETQYLQLNEGFNKVTVYLMTRLLDVEKPLTNQDIWLELRFKDRAPGDPHVKTGTTRGNYDAIELIPVDTDHIGMWLINGQPVPNAKEFKIDLIVKAGQDCTCPLSICYEYFTTVGEVYVDPYARVVQLDKDTLDELV